MIPITSFWTAPVLFWYSECSRITWPALSGYPSKLSTSPPAGQACAWAPGSRSLLIPHALIVSRWPRHWLPPTAHAVP